MTAAMNRYKIARLFVTDIGIARAIGVRSVVHVVPIWVKHESTVIALATLPIEGCLFFTVANWTTEPALIRIRAIRRS